MIVPWKPPPGGFLRQALTGQNWKPPASVKCAAVLMPLAAIVLTVLPTFRSADTAIAGTIVTAVVAELIIIITAVLRNLTLPLTVTNTVAAALLFLSGTLWLPTTGSTVVQMVMDISWMMASIAAVMTLAEAAARVLTWDEKHQFQWNTASVKLYWYLSILTIWCYFAWSILFGGSLILGRPGGEILDGLVAEFLAGLTGVLILIGVYAVLWTAYRSNLDPPGVVDRGYWHVRLDALLDVFVACTTIVIGVGGVFLGLYAGLGIDPDPVRREAGDTGALTAATVLLVVIGLRTWHKYYRQFEAQGELKHLRVALSDSTNQLRIAATALSQSNLLQAGTLAGGHEPVPDRVA